MVRFLNGKICGGIECKAAENLNLSCFKLTKTKTQEEWESGEKENSPAALLNLHEKMFISTLLSFLSLKNI